MSITLGKYVKTDKKQLKRLYLTAFPADERAPFFMLMSKAKRGKADMLTVRDNGEFIGFAYMVCDGKLAYLFYLAVDDSKRGKGYGTRIVEAVKKKYKGMRIFLAREQLDKSAENYAQRVSRRNFYLRCGFEDLPCCIKEGPVVYDVMGIGGTVTAEEYRSLMKLWAGFMLKIVDMRIIEKQVEE